MSWHDEHNSPLSRTSGYTCPPVSGAWHEAHSPRAIGVCSHGVAPRIAWHSAVTHPSANVTAFVGRGAGVAAGMISGFSCVAADPPRCDASAWGATAAGPARNFHQPSPAIAPAPTSAASVITSRGLAR